MDRSIQNRGMGLVEVVFYVAILALVLVVMGSALSSVLSSYRQIKATKIVGQTAQIVLERITRETRDALSLDLVSSTLNVSPGHLVLNTTDSEGNPTTVEFELNEGGVVLTKGGATIGPLTTQGANVVSLTFRREVTPQSEGIKIEMTASSGEGESYYEKNFYSTVVMRGSYPLQ